MITTLIILIVVAIVAIIASIVSDSGKKESETVIHTNERDKSTEYFGTLNDRNTAALNYEMMYRSLKRNTDDLDTLPEGVMESFDHVASHLATIGNNAKPQDVKGQYKKGISPFWGLIDEKGISHELN